MTTAGPLVSAVIPVYNAERYVTEAIESVLAQTYEAIECIVVDDGSTDRTSEVVCRLGDRVRYVRGGHRGVSAARNTGAMIARGQLLAFLDADDVWLPTKTERQVELISARPELGLVYCGLRRVDSGGQPVGTFPVPDPGEVIRNVLLQRGPQPSIAQTGLIPTAIFAATGGFDEQLAATADADLAWRIAARYEIDGVAEPLACYRSHPAQMHLDLAAYEHDVELLLRKAFASGQLPVDIRGLGRQARFNLALALAYAYRLEQPDAAQALRQVLRALWWSPARTARWLAAGAARRLRARIAPAPG